MRAEEPEAPGVSKPQVKASNHGKTRAAGRRPGFQSLRSQAASEGARRLGAAILEVLAGARTPLEAAAALGISAPRYYALEYRALLGLLRACEPRRRGRAQSEERTLERERKETERLKRECARLGALLRAAQRTVGLSPTADARGQKEKTPGGRRRRRPRLARALRAAAALQSAPGGEGEGAPGGGKS